MRTYLSVGSELKLNNITYQIDECLGEGAHCITYDAHIVGDTPIKVRIKECAPSFLGFNRVGDCIAWPSAEMKEAERQKYFKSYEKQVKFQNNPEIGNAFAKIQGKIEEANNTFYYVLSVDYGRTFDEDATDNINDVIGNIIGIARVIGRLHDIGYLHLDIKPENVLILNDRDGIKLIDTDSITSQDEIERGAVSIPYSEGWAAPEQLLCRKSKIGPATDVYAIGAVLYERLYGTCPNEDIISLFSDNTARKIDMLNNMSSPVNKKKISTFINRVVSKSIAASPARRYQSCVELICDLEEVLKLCSEDNFIESREPTSDIDFVGRQEEILNIHNAFSRGAKVVFIHGFGGMGKTELAKKYANEYRDDYETIYFDKYFDLDEAAQKNKRPGLKGYFQSIEFARKIDEDERRFELLKRLVNPNTLFVIDNYDIESDEDYDKYTSLNGKFLFTTRNDHSRLINSTTVQCETGVLDTESLLEIFEKNYSCKLSTEEGDIVKHIIDCFDNYTLLVPLVAKYIEESGSTIEEFYDELLSNGLQIYGDDSDEVIHKKDGELTQETLLGHLKKIFSISKLDESEKCVLANLYDLQDHIGLTKNDYKKYTNSKNLKLLNKMIKYGWVKTECVSRGYISGEEVHISIHPVISELVKEELCFADYHNDILTYSKELIRSAAEHYIYISDECRDDLGDALFLYQHVSIYDENKESIIGDITKFFESVFLNGSLEVNSYLGSRNFKYNSDVDYYLSEIVKSIENSACDTLKECFASIVVNSIAFYRDYHETTYFPYSEMGIFGVYCLANIEIRLAQLNTYIDMISAENNATEIHELLDMGYSVVNTFSQYFPMRLLCQNKALIEEITESEIHFVNRIEPVNRLYYLLLCCCKLLNSLMKKYNDPRIIIIENILISMTCIWQYHQGIFVDPFVKPDSYDQYPYRIDYNTDVCGITAIGMSRFICEIDKKKWQESLSKTLFDNVIIKTSSPVKIYEMILNSSFLSNQPKRVQREIYRRNIPKLIYEDNRLSSQEKRNLLVTVPSQGIREIVKSERSMESKRSKDTFESKYTTVLNIYQSCLYYVKDDILSDVFYINDIICDFFFAILSVNRIKHYADSKLLYDLDSVYTEKNIERYYENLDEIARIVYRSADCVEVYSSIRSKLDKFNS